MAKRNYLAKCEIRGLCEAGDTVQMDEAEAEKQGLVRPGVLELIHKGGKVVDGDELTDEEKAAAEAAAKAAGKGK